MKKLEKLKNIISYTILMEYLKDESNSTEINVICFSYRSNVKESFKLIMDFITIN